MNILLIIEQCNPEWSSVPLVGYNFFNEISRLADVTLVTHERNRDALEKVKENRNITYIPESKGIQKYYRIASRLTSGRGTNWPLLHALTYPVHAAFDSRVYDLFSEKVISGYYDIVHSITPILPRYPSKMIKACKGTPFILGPVNGGIPFPEGFGKVARKEFAHFNFLRFFSRVLPGYSRTYRKADRVLAGSTYTLTKLKKMFSIDDSHISLFFENGISQDFFRSDSSNTDKPSTLRLLFTGRLVPYKGANLLIDAVSRVKKKKVKDISLTIVGDGPEKKNLMEQAKRLGISDTVNFTGWINQSETFSHYSNSDIFCFPSIREFGGAVVLEAMACGLPCIVINYGGIGEYVTEKTGFKIDPVSNEYITDELVNKIEFLIKNKEQQNMMSRESIKRAKEFQWSSKAQNLIGIYNELINKSRTCS